ncbi:MAG: class I SAM-dependent methyltransferase [Acidimicrobiia bacterium]
MGDDFFIRHRDRRALFGDDVSAYDIGRPGYPERVYQLLRDRCGLAPGAQALEIGPGTGQATRCLLELGASVTGVELSPELAHRLRRNHHGQDLEVIVAAFEEATLPLATFDLVAAATCFHWIPTDVGLRRCAQLLRDGGSMALWWTYFGDHSRPDPFRDALTPILRRLAPELLDTQDTDGPDAPPPYVLDVEGAALSHPCLRRSEAHGTSVADCCSAL